MNRMMVALANERIKTSIVDTQAFVREDDGLRDANGQDPQDVVGHGPDALESVRGGFFYVMSLLLALVTGSSFDSLHSCRHGARGLWRLGRVDSLLSAVMAETQLFPSVQVDSLLLELEFFLF